MLTLPRYVRRHGTGFRVVLTVNGKRTRSPTFSTVEEAEAWRSDFLRFGGADRRHLVEITFAGALDLILEDLRATGGREGTRKWYTEHARTIIAHFGKGAMLHRIGHADVVGFVEKRRAAGISPSTIVKRDVQIMRRMFKLAREAGYPLPVDPFARLKLPRVRTGRFDFLTQNRLTELVAVMRNHKAPLAAWHADVVEFLFATGIRRAELFRLRVQDIDLDGGRIAIDGKTGNRDQPFGRTLEPLLRRLIDAAGPGGKIVPHPAGLVAAFGVWQKRLGEPRLSFHTLRHSHATAMARHVNPFELMALLGHSSITQTSRYVHATGDAVRGALDRLQVDEGRQA